MAELIGGSTSDLHDDGAPRRLRETTVDRDCASCISLNGPRVGLKPADAEAAAVAGGERALVGDGAAQTDGDGAAAIGRERPLVDQGRRAGIVDEAAAGP